MFRTWISFTFSFSDLPSILLRTCDQCPRHQQVDQMLDPAQLFRHFVLILIRLSQHHNSAFLLFRHNFWNFPGCWQTSQAHNLITIKNCLQIPLPAAEATAKADRRILHQVSQHSSTSPPYWDPPPFRIHNSAQFWWFPQLFPFLSGVPCMQNWIPSVQKLAEWQT